MISDADRLNDILKAIARIEKHTAKGRPAFDGDELVQVWVLHHIQIIGEAARKLSTDLQIRHPEVPWAQVIGMRNILVHQYSTVDPDAVWNTVESDLPLLKRKVEAILLSVAPLKK